MTHCLCMGKLFPTKYNNYYTVYLSVNDICAEQSYALNPLVSVIGRLVARSSRKRGNRQTDGRTEFGMTKQLL